MQTDVENVVDNGDHSIANMQQTYCNQHGCIFNRGLGPRDTCFIDRTDSAEWAGKVLWDNGVLRVLSANEDFPANRELLFFHRPNPVVVPLKHTGRAIVREMIKFGYYLPDWEPRLTRIQCVILSNGSLAIQKSAIPVPYNGSCFGG